MSDFLKAVNRAGLIEKLDGDDERFTKMEAAAERVSTILQEEPPQLIRAVLAGLDPDIPADDPAIQMAEKALIEEWTSLNSVHPDPPILIYRAILLDACDHVAEESNAVILWNTVTDTLPLMRLGKEESAIREMLTRWAETAEQFALVVPTVGEIKRAPTSKKIELYSFDPPEGKVVNENNLKNGIAKACGPSTEDGTQLDNANDYWPNNAQNWAWPFTDKMTA